MTGKLFATAILKYCAGVVIIGLLLFLPGTFGFWQGWLLMGILFIPMFAAGIVMMVKNPALLEKRLNAREQENEQKQVLLLSAVMFIAAFIAAGLGYRFGFILPTPVSIIAAVLFLGFYALYAEVLRENTYLSRTVEVQENQKVIDTGLYGIVRHPMYMATVGLFLMMPLVLGSGIGFLIMLVYIPILAKRIRNEEQVLMEGLPGYREYMRKVRYRMIPFVY
ncbi:MAG: isoprenylcysteine carboxylmethyltransferase family protein [Oscillospiraceae bacterium]|nr:isoprenylcysteine carboxylmethyltransferase family protein [Oscillospiraceae bacterium]